MDKYDSAKDMPWTVREANRTENTAYVSVAHSYPIRTAETEKVAHDIALTVFENSTAADLFDVIYSEGMVYKFKVLISN